VSVLAELTWQHQALLFETVLSCVIGCAIIARGTLQRNWKTGVGFTLWNAVVAYLLIAGAREWAWQYTAYAIYLVLDQWAVVHSAVTNRRSEIPEEQKAGNQFLTIAWMVTVFALIGTAGATA
jgi:hypothetical protein